MEGSIHDSEFNDEELWFDDEDFPTHTSEEQIKTERKIEKFYSYYNKVGKTQLKLKILRKEHTDFLMKGIRGLSSGYQSLDASRPWLVYWISHALDLLDTFPHGTVLPDRIAEFLNRCQDKEVGGFAGGPGQPPHLAPTYAAVNALMICGTEKAFSIINREKMYSFLLSLKDPQTGAFVMHKDGELDLRGSYCALSVASVLNIMTPELTCGTAEYIAKCQTYEGGIGGAIGNEAHGGYAFCGLAALFILGRTDLINIPNLVYWAVNRQMKYEGGFQGRTNKLVDSCYSFWQGGIFPLLSMILQDDTPEKEVINETIRDADGSWLFNQRELQKYLLLCCQEKEGGMRDKPGKSRDYYHTCYALSGLSIAQHNNITNWITVEGDPSNLLKQTHPVYNVSAEKVNRAISYFSKFPTPQ